MKNDYLRGQLDLIQDIKQKVAKMEETTTIKDFPFDIVHLLKTIKPIEDEDRSK
jgi:hypothetical protein